MVFFSLATNSEHQHSTGDHLRCRVRWLGPNFQLVMVVTLLMFATCSSSAVLAVDTVGSVRGLLNEDALNASGEQKGKQDDGTHLVLIAENLMLQRIVEAIREDELDTSWEVTGKVTEYFDENRLTIITAQRAESKDLMPSPTR